MPPGFDSSFDAPASGGHEATYRVSELNAEIRDVLGEVFPGLWVMGEVHRPRASQRGHLYFELVEKGRGDEVVGKLDAVLWRMDHQRVRRRLADTGQEIRDGQEVRCFGHLDFYGPGGRLQFVVRDVDPVFSLGHLERRRRETMRALEQAGLLDANAALDLPELPLRVGLVTSHDSAAYHDFLAGLRDSQYGFRVVFVHASMQGRQAEPEVSTALRALAALEVDVVALVRGGGSRTDLAAFDSRRIAEAIARCPRPVLCGLGHEIDRSISDTVCHTSVKTPTQAAALLVDRVAAAEERLRAMERDLGRAARRVIDSAERRVHGVERIVTDARHVLTAAGKQVDAAARALGLLARRRLAEAGDRVAALEASFGPATREALDGAQRRRIDLGRRIAQVAGAHLRRQDAVLGGMERLCHGLAPARLLERGYSITRGPDGQVVTDPDQVRSGDRLRTRLAGGEITSRVDAEDA